MERIMHAATVIPVTDMFASLDFYCNTLGFHQNFLWKDPPEYAVLKRGETSIHLTLIPDYEPPKRRLGCIYIFVNQVEELHREFVEKGVRITAQLDEQEYHMKDFDLTDPDGNILIFGESSI